MKKNACKKIDYLDNILNINTTNLTKMIKFISKSIENENNTIYNGPPLSHPDILKILNSMKKSTTF